MDLFAIQERAHSTIKRATRETAISLSLWSLLLSGIFTLGTILALKLFGSEITEWLAWQFLGLYLLFCATVVILLSSRARRLSRQPLAVQMGVLGGSHIDMRTRCLKERRAIQILDELSLAAGIPAPQLFCMRSERGINACSLARGVTDTAVCITQGALTELPRPELEALIAHEVFRILRGEAELGLELLVVMHPFFAAHTGGAQLKTVEEEDARFKEHQVYSPSGRSGLLLSALGGLLQLLGAIPALYGIVLRRRFLNYHAIERDKLTFQCCHRENGILALLARLVQSGDITNLQNPRASECSLLFFAAASGRILFFGPQLHPAPRRRAKVLDPMSIMKLPNDPSAAQLTEKALYRYTPIKFLDSVGLLERSHIKHASVLLKSLPAGLHEMAKVPHGAQDIVLALVLSSDLPTRIQQIEGIRKTLRGVDEKVLSQAYALVHSLSDLHLLPLVHLVVPTLRRLNGEMRNDLARLLIKTARRDGFRTLPQFTIAALVARLLTPEEILTLAEWSHPTLDVNEDLALLLSFLAHSGSGSPERAVRAYCHGAELLGITQPLRPLARNSARQLFATLQRLARIRPLKRKHVLHVCAEVLAAEGHLTARDAEILRAIGTILNCPHSPLVAEEISAGPLLGGGVASALIG